MDQRRFGLSEERKTVENMENGLLEDRELWARLDSIMDE
jgi:hypothetical protein